MKDFMQIKIVSCNIVYCYVAGVSLDLTSALIGWFLVMWYMLKSNVARAGNNSKMVASAGYNSKIVAHAGHNTKLILFQSGTEYNFSTECCVLVARGYVVTEGGVMFLPTRVTWLGKRGKNPHVYRGCCLVENEQYSVANTCLQDLLKTAPAYGQKNTRYIKIK